ERPALKRLIADIASGQVDCVVVYKVDRLSRSLLDFARMMEIFEQHQVSFVSVTQQFNTAMSMGGLVLNVLCPSPSSSGRSSPSGRGTRLPPPGARGGGRGACRSWATTSIPEAASSWSMRLKRFRCVTSLTST